MNGKKMLAVGAAATAMAVAGIVAAKASQQNARADIAAPLTEGLRPGAHIEQYVAQLVGQLRAIDRDGDGLDRADVDFQKLRYETQERARNIQQVLVHDYDGDFRVTRAEIERGIGGPESQRSRQAESQLTLYDADGDGVITMQEAAGRERNAMRDRSLGALLVLDPNGDGKLTAIELMARAQQAFKSLDSDGDGTLSPEEYAVIADRVQEIQVTRNAPTCDISSLPKDAELVVFSAYEGAAISSAVIGGQDVETNVIDVTIEPGSRPLYLVLTSYESMVWRLRGATGRVQNVAISSVKAAPGGVSASGVMGVPAAKVHISRAGCPSYFSNPGGSDAQRALASIKASLQREADAVFATYSLQAVALPSGRMTPADPARIVMPKGFDAATWPDAARFWPGGLVAVDPGQVVAKSAVRAYQVLPSQMGISQLIGAGAVRREQGDVFRVLKPIAHMPPSMGGAHSVTLIFSKGVPVAPGSAGHSCIVDENSGESLGARCRSRR